MSRPIKCGHCHEAGHNKRTCPKAKLKASNRCGYCWEKGHSVINCPTYDPRRAAMDYDAEVTQ